MMDTLDQRIADANEQGKALLEALREKLAKLDLPGGSIVIPDFDTARFTLEEDKYNGEQTLMASFYPRPNYRAGVLLFHSDGSCYAEYHVMQIYPAKPKWFVESVEAWIRDGKVEADMRLVAMPS
jgi:hypothetical protein